MYTSLFLNLCGSKWILIGFNPKEKTESRSERKNTGSIFDLIKFSFIFIFNDQICSKTGQNISDVIKLYCNIDQ